jgi:large subunit ribosomal protein L25
VKETYTLIAEERIKTGKGGARKVRAEGQCPAVVYSPDFGTKNIKIDPKALLKLLQAGGESSLIDLQVAKEGKDDEILKVIIREVSYPPIGDSPEHIDFYSVSLDKAISISVSISLVGENKAVARKEGSLNQMAYEVHIECLPNDIPESVELDISELQLGQVLHASDLNLGEKVVILDSADTPLVVLNVVHEEEEEEEVEAEVETAEPEVIGQDQEEPAAS